MRFLFVIWDECNPNVCMDAYLRYGNFVEIKGRLMLFLMFTRTNNRFSLGMIKSYKPFLRPGWDISRLRTSAEATGYSTIMQRLVSSANKRMIALMSLPMSFMKLRKSKGPMIEP